MTAGRASAAVALVAAAVVILGFGGRAWFFLDALGHFRLHAGATALVLGVFSALRGARAVGAAAAAVGLAGLAALGPGWREPARPAPPGPAREMVVAVANLYAQNADHAAAYARLAALGADVVVTLETPPAAAEDGSALRAGFRHFAPNWRAYQGSARVWSNRPVALIRPPAKTDRGDAGSRKLVFGVDLPARVAVRADLGEGAALDVLGLQFRRPLTQTQERQIANLAETLPALERPLVVLGDFNAAPWSVALARIAERLDVRVVGGLRPTWRSIWLAALDPLGFRVGLPIDHILVSEGVGVVSIAPFDIPGSDHRGVIARLRVPLAPGAPTPRRRSGAGGALHMRGARAYVSAVGRRGVRRQAMRIGIIQTGRVRGHLADLHGEYPAMFEALVGPHAPDFRFETVAVVDGAALPPPGAFDGYLITGSRHGVYDDVPWIAPLEAWLREVRAIGRPIVGVCFGHQLLAEAFGGRAVKHEGGWRLGAHEFTTTARPAWAAAAPDRFRLHSVHQDQVVAIPPDASVWATGEGCVYAGLAYGDPDRPDAISIQPHPEMSAAFTRDLAQFLHDDARVPPEIGRAALAQIGLPTDAAAMGALFADYLRGAAAAKAAA